MKHDIWNILSIYSLKLAIVSVVLMIILIIANGVKTIYDTVFRTDRHCYKCNVDKGTLGAVECSDGTVIFICPNCATELKTNK